MSKPSTAVIHFYRASVQHADVWRTRLDATTNWTVVTNAGLISFAFGSPSSPHFILLLLLFMDIIFLVIESRRYQTYDIWNRRLRKLHRYVIAPELAGTPRPSKEEIAENLTELADDLGHTKPRLSLVDAMGFRIRRNYAAIFAVTLGAWGLKLWSHPTEVETFVELIHRARAGGLPGWAVWLVVTLAVLGTLLLMVRAPTERMVRWAEEPSLLKRILSLRLFYRPPSSDELEDRQRRP